MGKNSEEIKDTTDPSLFRKLHRLKIAKKTGRCSLCPPHGGENRTWTKRGVQKRKNKNKRRQ